LKKRLSKAIDKIRLFKCLPVITINLKNKFYESKVFKTFAAHPSDSFGLFNHYNEIKLWKVSSDNVTSVDLLQSENDIYSAVNFMNNQLEGYAVVSNYSSNISVLDIETRKVSQSYYNLLPTA